MTTLLIWILAAAFFLAGVINAIGTQSTRRDFARWGYPEWWGKLTGILEICCAGMLIYSGSLLAGLTLGSIIIAAALVTLVRFREFKHLIPAVVYAVLILTVWLRS